MDGIESSGTWEWQDDSFKLDSESPLALSRSLWDELSQSEADSRYLFASTPSTEIREPQTACLTANGEERHIYKENFERGALRFKRRRMLLFSETQSCALVDDSSLHVDPFKNYGNHMMEGSNDYIMPHQASPVSMCFTKGELGDESYSSMEYNSMEDAVEQPSDTWMAKCFVDSEAQSCEEMKTAAPSHEFSGACKEDKDECNADTRQSSPAIQTKTFSVHQHVKPAIGTPLAYPFALLKPCGAQGDVTLSDINQRIQKPASGLKKSYVDQDLKQVHQSWSGLSGKSVVALTKIQTEGNGTITIMRTKG